MSSWMTEILGSDAFRNIFVVVVLVAVVRWRGEKWASMLPKYNYFAWIGGKIFAVQEKP